MIKTTIRYSARVLAIGLFLVCSDSLILAQATNKNAGEIETVIKKFWEGLGRLDAEGLKQVMDWPVTIVEASASGNKQNVLRNPLEFDEEFKRTPSAAIERCRSEFYGTRVLAFKVQMLNANLASVSCLCLLPKDIVERKPGAARFNALAVLRRDPKQGRKWKIVFITVPK